MEKITATAPAANKGMGYDEKKAEELANQAMQESYEPIPSGDDTI